jgi:hypothetical protein
MMDERTAQATILRNMKDIREKHPRESKEGVLKRLTTLIDGDPALKEALLVAGFCSINDEALDDLLGQ